MRASDLLSATDKAAIHRCFSRYDPTGSIDEDYIIRDVDSALEFWPGLASFVVAGDREPLRVSFTIYPPRMRICAVLSAWVRFPNFTPSNRPGADTCPITSSFFDIPRFLDQIVRTGRYSTDLLITTAAGNQAMISRLLNDAPTEASIAFSCRLADDPMSVPGPWNFVFEIDEQHYDWMVAREHPLPSLLRRVVVPLASHGCHEIELGFDTLDQAVDTYHEILQGFTHAPCLEVADRLHRLFLDHHTGERN